MQTIRDPKVLARFQMTFDLYQTAEDIMRQNLRRRFPEASEEEVERRLEAWLRKEPIETVWSARSPASAGTAE